MQGTFRDPSGSLFDAGGRILRIVRPSEAAGFEALLGTAAVAGLVARGALVGTRRVDARDVPSQLQSLDGTWFEHDRIGFTSLPAEWSAAMLAQAALHTLNVNEELLRQGLILKDATPANILFDGARPVLVDVPSIESLRVGQNLWIARHQFEATFLLPLIALLDAGYPIQASLADPAAGLSHERLARVLGPRRWWTISRIRHVALAAALGQAGARRGGSPVVVDTAPAAGGKELEKARFVLSHSLRGLRRAIEHLVRRIDRRHSHWSAYAGTRCHYTDADLQAKRAFVQRALQQSGADWVLDIGANTGEFSEMAAARGNVVAIDLDEVSVSAIYSRARAAGTRVLPLVVDLSQPTPATGWRNAERKSFLERAVGRFDLALMLAVGHHLRVTAGIPLEQIVETGLQLGGGSLVFEFVPTTDPMFRTIARGREALYQDNTVQNCAALLAARGRIEMQETLQNGRTLFWVRSERSA